MELKAVGYESGEVFVMRFNRTFMELKEELEALRLAIIRFQSHLYGIERMMSLMMSP